MDIDWSGTTVETGELSINYARAGKGFPVIFLHGWPEFNRTWLHALPALAERFDCIAPDLRGFGRTVSKVPRSPDGTPVGKLAKDVLDLADALGLHRFAIVSHDVGSFVAQQTAIAAPDRVAALFFFNCTYPGIGKRGATSAIFARPGTSNSIRRISPQHSSARLATPAASISATS